MTSHDSFHARRRWWLALPITLFGLLLVFLEAFGALALVFEEETPVVAQLATGAQVREFDTARGAAEADQLDLVASGVLTGLGAVFSIFEDEAISAERRAIWEHLADCESGNWSRGWPVEGSHRWDYGLTFNHGDFFEGGLNFHPRTWDSYREPWMPGHAGQATAIEQMVIAERVLADQGWRAWPVCSRKLGYR